MILAGQQFATVTMMIAISTGGLTLICALWAAIVKHSTNSTKHPDKTALVYKDVCESEKRGMAEQIKQQGVLFNEKVANIQKSLEAIETLLDKVLNGN
jgi:hypothetical protein